jgi:hypothetical protein
LTSEATKQVVAVYYSNCESLSLTFRLFNTCAINNNSATRILHRKMSVISIAPYSLKYSAMTWFRVLKRHQQRLAIPEAEKDGASPHTAKDIRALLRDCFGERIIS